MTRQLHLAGYLTSGGDIRFLNPGRSDLGTSMSGLVSSGSSAVNGVGSQPSLGSLLVADNLTMTARTIYPETDTAFLLMSRNLVDATIVAGSHDTISFAGNGQAPVAPLSANGAIIVDARTIAQGGALMAPLGAIQLGFGPGESLPKLFVTTAGSNPYNPGTSFGYVGIYGSGLATIVTDSVTLAPGSLTSVSANGLSIPYGATTDGVNWSENGTTLAGPPAKLIVLGGGKVDAQKGAVIDSRGGGDVYATEFVPGTGGSRNVLTTSTQTVYALVPGYDAAVAAYDPSFGATVPLGASVTLPGGNGVAAGTYTLLPAQYATMPGAYRVVVVSSGASRPPVSFVAPDGSVYMTGTLGNAITGASSPQTALLQIQSNAVWTKYSEIDIASGNSYFARLAAANATATPRLARDAGQLSVAAATALTLNATNLFAPASGGRGGQLDITGGNLLVAASDLLSNFGAASANGGFTPNADYAGYLFLDADQIGNLGIESVLIGGTRSSTAGGTLISATALNLEVATDAAHPLTGPDLLLASLAPTAADPSVHGLKVDSGSVIAARGAVAAGSSTPLVIGVDPLARYDGAGNLTGYAAGVSGDGALLRVSNGDLVTVTRHFVPGVYQIPATTPAPAGPASTVARGSLSIGDNVALSGNALTLDTSGDNTLAQSASLKAKNYDLSGSTINLGGGDGGLVVTSDLIGKFAGADAVRLRSASVFNLYGDNSFGAAAAPIGALILDGAGFYSDGGAASITASNIVFVNNQTVVNDSGANTGGTGGSLAIDASGAVSFGAGTKTLFGFATVDVNAGSEILFTGAGGLDAKAGNVTLTAPAVIANAGGKQSLATKGALTLTQGAGAAPVLAPTDIGGALTLTGGSIADSGALIAQGGSLTLEATSGDLALSDTASINAAGTRILLHDLTEDTPGGTIKLISDAGKVTLGANTLVDVSAAGNGYAGALAIAAAGAATLGGTLKGGAAYNDLGGEFTLIAGQLSGGLPLSSGFTRSFAVSLAAGDIAIAGGQTLTSANVLLVANNGAITVDGAIDASSPSGGSIGLYGAGDSTGAAGAAGASGVTIGAGARLYARYRAADPNSPAYANGASTLAQRGGTITLGATGTPDGTLNAAYGYQNVPGSGAITVASGAIFDVSGGPGGADIDNTGGSVIVRAPILANNNINVSFRGTIVTNAKPDGGASGNPLVANAFAVWSATDSAANPNNHFDGIIDPAGFFDATGKQLIFADANGLYPASTADTPAPGAYLPHVNFYQTTLLDFVNAPFDAAAVAGDFAGAQLQIGAAPAAALPAAALHLRPEIDLVNPTPATGATSINGGNITVASNWNFGAGSIDTNGNINLLYRTTNGGEPGTLTLRAANNVKINATITDGFFANYVASNATASAASQYDAESSSSLNLAYLAMFSPVDGKLQYDASGIFNLAAKYRQTWESFVGFVAPPVTSPASPEFFGVSPDVFNSLQFQIQRPSILSCGGGSCPIAIIDQYNQYYAEYVSMFHAYAAETVGVNTSGTAGYGVTGGAYLSLPYYTQLLNAYGLTVDTAPIAVPTAPSLSGNYYNISSGLQLGFNSASGFTAASGTDYASQWVAYFYNILNTNLTLFGTPFSKLPTLSSVPGAEAGIYFLIAATPPYAPPAYTSLQPGNQSSLTTNPATPADLIANNPAIYSVGNVAVYNTTSSANLMTAAASGKGSFSYDFVGGALFNASGASSVNPNAVVPVSALSPTATGNVTIDGHTSYTNPLTSLTVNVPTLVRTGTGSITVAAAGDFALLDAVSPGAVYTAGYVADNAAGFTAPTLPAGQSNGLITTPVWATGGGSISIAAGRDIIGVETPVDPTGTQYRIASSTSNPADSIGVSTAELWSAWYYVDGNSTGSATTPFDPNGTGAYYLPAVQYASWINYGTFFQGLGALGGGDITLKAGRDVRDISASLPETIQVSGGQSATGPTAAAHYYGGGDLLVEAAGDVLSGAYYVGRGAGLIRAGGQVAADASVYEVNNYTIRKSYPDTGNTPLDSVPLLLGVQDSFISVQATGSITLGGIYQPTRIPADLARNAGALPATIGASFDSYGANSGVALASTGGSVSFEISPAASSLFTRTPPSGYGGDGGDPVGLIPPNLALTAFTGDINLISGPDTNINLYPSATGELSLLAGGSVNGAPPRSAITILAMLDRVNSFARNGGASFPLTSPLGVARPALTAPLHAGDDTPVLIYAGEDITGGVYSLLKQARLWAGRDISNIAFTGMNDSAGDITSLIAGRDIAAKQTVNYQGLILQGSLNVTLYGPGDLLLSAGRDLGPFNTSGYTSAGASVGAGGGILAIGNGGNSGQSISNNAVLSGPISYLPLAGADFTLLYGAGPGVDYAAAIAQYGDPAAAAASGIDFVPTIIPQLEQLVDGLIVAAAKAAGIANPRANIALTPGEAAALFQALPTLDINQKLDRLAAGAGFANLSFNLKAADMRTVQQAQQRMKLAIDRGFLDLLTRVSLDYNNSASPYYGKFARAYTAISTLFPASLGYTDNNTGGSSGASATVHTGDLRMARSLIETQTGGDINILGPGGNAIVGSNSADALSPAQQGILTLQGGSIRSYTDGSAQIYQSRIFTEQGGDIDMFSANGDLNAGKGPKSSAAYPPLRLICDSDGYCRVSPAGLVTGAGVGALLSIPGQDPAKSNVVLTAPHGTVDAGAAGIRVAGNLNIVALHIANAFNIEVGGATVGIPTQSGPPVAALTTASTANAATQQTALPAQSGATDQPSIILVEFLGFGGGDGAPQPRQQDDQSGKSQDKQSYNTNSVLQLVGNGPLSDAQKRALTAEEKRNLGDQ